ncbi:MAG: hypothetical protein F7B18_01535 [Desulfurococcales archaeon]|nr:hypothetical protein [Desulfurococcales archaeon]
MPKILQLLREAGYTITRRSPEGLAAYSPQAWGAPVVASLDPPGVLVGWRGRVIRPPRSGAPGRFEACILSPGMDRVEGTGIVEEERLRVTGGRVPLWGIATPLEEASQQHRLKRILEELAPTLLILVKWHTGTTPCSAAKLLAGHTPLTDHLPNNGCNLPRPKTHPTLSHGI